MVLVVNGVQLKEAPSSSASFYLEHPSFRETALQFHKLSEESVGPAGLLYIGQREMAATIPQDKNVSILGTDDMTSCIAVALRHSRSGAIALAHFDGSETENAVHVMIQKVKNLTGHVLDGRLELRLVGGFSDSRNSGEELFCDIIDAFHNEISVIDLTFCCVAELNAATRDGLRRPIFYGIGVHVKNAELFPATFTDKGPEQPLRTARHLSDNHELLDIYDHSSGLIKFGPFNYDYDTLGDIDWLAQSDRFILNNLSTTPAVEPPHFVSQIRATIKYMRENKFPTVTVFKDNKPHCFRRDVSTGTWQPV